MSAITPWGEVVLQINILRPIQEALGKVKVTIIITIQVHRSLVVSKRVIIDNLSVYLVCNL